MCHHPKDLKVQIYLNYQNIGLNHTKIIDLFEFLQKATWINLSKKKCVIWNFGTLTCAVLNNISSFISYQSQL